MNASISYLGKTPAKLKQPSLLQQKIEDIENNQADVIEALSQCAASPLSYDQELRIFNAFNEGDTSELGLMIHELMQNQIKEMAEAIS